MKTTEEMIEVMQAHADGKKIEESLIGHDKWSDCYCPDWDWSSCDFRVKKEPLYRPYKSVDEMLNDFCDRCKEHGIEVSRFPMGEPFIWLLSKDGKTLKLVTGFDEGNGIYKVIIDGKLATFQSIFEFYTYKDGSPCGKKVKE